MLGATVQVPVIDGRSVREKQGRVVAKTYEKDPVLDVRLSDGSLVFARESQATVIEKASAS